MLTSTSTTTPQSDTEISFQKLFKSVVVFESRNDTGRSSLPAYTFHSFTASVNASHHDPIACVPISQIKFILDPNHQQVSIDFESIFSQLTLLAAYGTLLIAGLVLNLGLIYRAVWHSKMALSRLAFMLNLLLADLLLCASSLPLTPIVSVLSSWPFGRPLCKAMSSCQPIAITVSVWSLVFVVINKYLYIVSVRRQGIRKKLAILFAIAVWLFGGLMCLPYVLVTDLVSGQQYADPMWPGGLCGDFCVEQWPVDVIHNQHQGYDLRLTASCVFIAVDFIAPLLIMSYCYWRMFVRIQNDLLRTHKRHSDTSTNCRHSDANERSRYTLRLTARRSTNTQLHLVSQRRKRRVVCCSIVVVVGFLTAWLPLLTRNLIHDLQIDMGSSVMSDHQVLIGIITHLLAMSTVVMNPLLIWWLGRQQQQHLPLKPVNAAIKIPQLHTQRHIRSTRNELLVLDQSLRCSGSSAIEDPSNERKAEETNGLQHMTNVSVVHFKPEQVGKPVSRVAVDFAKRTKADICMFTTKERSKSNGQIILNESSLHRLIRTYYSVDWLNRTSATSFHNVDNISVNVSKI